MHQTRRFFIKNAVGFAAAMPIAAHYSSAAEATPVDGILPDFDLTKSIKANFGGRFSVRSVTQANDLVIARIEHAGNVFEVSTRDTIEWSYRSVARAS